MRRLLLLSVLLVSSACASTQKAFVDVTELPATDSWRVHMRFAKPVERIDFERARGGAFRAAAWNVLSPAGATWDGESIVLPSPAREVVIALPSDTREREKDYNLTFAFTDGSRLLYTGHLRMGGFPHVWKFRSTRGVRTVPLDDPENGTYVYFGDIPAIETQRMTLIVDPGLPAWVEQSIREQVPPQFDYFARRTGHELNFKPLVLLSYGGEGAPGYSFKGGTLPGLVQMAIHGRGWTTQSRDGERQWYGRVAHEIFHLWDGQMFPPAQDAEWLSEAGAEWWSLEAMRDAKLIDESERRKAVVAAANECIARADGKPIPQSHSRNFYSCGLVTQELTRDAASIWKTLFAKGRPYTTADFLAATQVPSVHTFVSTGVAKDELPAFLEKELNAIGVRVTRDGAKLRYVP